MVLIRNVILTVHVRPASEHNNSLLPSHAQNEQQSKVIFWFISDPPLRLPKFLLLLFPASEKETGRVKIKVPADQCMVLDRYRPSARCLETPAPNKWTLQTEEERQMKTHKPIIYLPTPPPRIRQTARPERNRRCLFPLNEKRLMWRRSAPNAPIITPLRPTGAAQMFRITEFVFNRLLTAQKANNWNISAS